MRKIKYRKDEIIALCHEKTVLHLGFIQHAHLYQKMIDEGKWLHNKIEKVAKKIVGIDFLREEVSTIRDKYKIECYYGDVCKLEECEHRDKYDVIVCGELIEHLENPGLMLDGIKEYMHEDSLLIITTPNPWAWTRLKLIKKGKLEDHWLNPEHTCWFSHGTLNQFLDRKGFEIIQSGYTYDEAKDAPYEIDSPIVRKFYALKDRLRKRLLPEHYFRGLFFVCRIDAT